MQKKLRLYTCLKHVDLACLSAKEAIRDLLGFSDLLDLKRYLVWELDYKGTDQHSLESWIKASYYLVNPNKQSYTINEFPHSTSDSHDVSAYYLTVKPKEKRGFASLLKKISQRCPGTLLSLDQSTLWKLSIRSSSDQKDIKQDLVDRVIVSSHIDAGLLVNPLNESFDLKSHAEFYGSN